jgi:group II intron reverse transcriptase/maturase
VVAIHTTPDESKDKRPVERKLSLLKWVKRTQEVLAHRSLEGKTFSRLYRLLCTKRLIEVALDNVLDNAGANTPGVDGITKSHLAKEEARERLTDEIHREMCEKSYNPQPVRRVYVPKPNGGQRPLGIPTIKDRTVQEMLRLILEPIYEAHFHRHSYGFRPFRSTHHAAVRLKDLIGRRGYTYAIEGDIRKCFDRICHSKLLKILRRTIKDERLIRMIRRMLKAGVMEDEAWHVTDEGTPQGGIVSPLLANIYLNELDWYVASKWEAVSRKERRQRTLCGTALPCYVTRYADDFVVLVRGTREQAELLKADIAEFLKAELHLELSEEKTLTTPVEQGFDFLGFHIRKYKRVSLITPSRKAMTRFREKVKDRVQEGFNDSDAAAIVHLNRYLIGWGMYYRAVSSKRAFTSGDHYVWHRVWRTSHRRRSARRTRAQHIRAHLIQYQYDVRQKNRWRKGGHYGVWADRAQTKAHIVVKLAFIPIRYVFLHPQLNPYVPEERKKLERRTPTVESLPDQRPEPMVSPIYGEEWDTLRRMILEQAQHQCQRCGKRIRGRSAHVHHRQKRKAYKSRSQANLMENLIALCSACHRAAENLLENEGLESKRVYRGGEPDAPKSARPVRRRGWGNTLAER